MTELPSDRPRVVLRDGGLRLVPDEAARLGASRVLLIAGGSAAAPGDTVAGLLGDRLAGRVTEIAQHVPADLAERAVRRAVEVDADLIVTIGGGSATGLGKAVARKTGLRILAVPTTFSGSEATPIWGLTEGGHKTTGRDPRVRPATVIYDPELFATLPADLAVTSALNAFAHCVEGLYAPDATGETNDWAATGIDLLTKGLTTIGQPNRQHLLRGGFYAGLVLGATTMGLHHKLAHILGGTYRLPHAATHAVLLPYVTAANAAAAPEAMTRAATAMGRRKSDVAAGIWELARGAGAPRSLAELGWPAGAADEVIDAVLAAPPANPHPIGRDWLRRLLLAAHRGGAPGGEVSPA
ncbi:maleylacetate reductase [Asanoa ferruginea]|uniref:Maleylacetate reductase n=1 Tax=Asanoa ferruginea TaxID=53367 RepID=A0A3D9ZSE1_9ACTN|nr:maleylacetate reductase [Asanoa ferruginea]REF99799.1 maleylacetate reductase [Asanoa ferruginea]GIF51817.1 maleylacetate reductase [Asanoa ferruginea]